MVVTSRAALIVSLGLLGLASMAAPALADPPAAKDAAVRKAASQSQPAASTPKPPAPVPMIVGTVDFQAAIKGYDKYKAQVEEYKGAAMAKHAELMKLQTEGQEEAQKLSKLTQGSVDAKKIEDRLTDLKAKLEAGREQAQREFAMKESEMMATLCKEVQEMVKAVAQWRGMNYVLQISNEPISSSNPNSVVEAIGRSVVVSDPRNDITRDVVHNLNTRYQAAGGVVPKATSAAPAATTPAGN
jgi:Skp family chaperone for outer membrane proteins